ncbi:MAG: hypothetical protein RL326_1037 [Pseudomonadota bacterium]
MRLRLGGGDYVTGYPRPARLVIRMIDWFKRLFSGSASTQHALSAESIRSIEDILKTPGKACSTALMTLAAACDREKFVDIVSCSSLVGSAIRSGEIHSRKPQTGNTSSTPTFLFKSAEVASFVNGMPLAQSIFVLRKERSLHTGPNFVYFNIGRATDNDIRIVDFAISRQHARVNFNGRHYSVADLGSQNGTKVNGVPVSDLPQELVDGDIISLARYEFCFMSPMALYDCLRERVGKGS